MTTERWEPDRVARANPWPMPSLGAALGRGFRGFCPACGKTHLFRRFLKVVDACPDCGAPLGLARADDAPPYFTILIVGHVIVPLLFIAERFDQIPLWLISAVFVPLTVALTLALIQPVKGATVGLMLNLNMLKTDPSAP